VARRSIEPTAPRTRPPVGELSWRALNDFLRDATEAECVAMMQEEEAGRARLITLDRINCRRNKMRTQRERRELHDRLKR
jgi:hypothetical protein